jgi:hypothetical protein
MTDKQHYESSFMKPPAGSLYAFHVVGFKILRFESQLQLPPWSTIEAPPADASPMLANYIRRQNAALAKFDSAIEQDARAALAAQGYPDALLKEPISFETRCAIDALKAAMRNILRLKFTASYDESARAQERMAEQEKPDRVICIRVVHAAFRAFGGDNAEATAKYLNREALEKGLTRHHVTNAVNAYRRRADILDPADAERAVFKDAATLAKLKRALAVTAEFEDIIVLKALDLVRAEARKKEQLERLRGAELARAIHEHFDLYERVQRATVVLAERIRDAA